MMINLLLSVLAVAFCFYYFWKKKDLRILLASLIIVSTQLNYEPFFIDRIYTFSGMSLVFGIIHIYLYSYKQKIKNAYVFSLVFFLLAAAFLIIGSKGVKCN